MPLISVITCVLPRTSEWLAEAWRSLQSQSLPAGWDWEFLLQIDGQGELTSDIPEHDSRIHVFRNPKSLGPAMARNMALGRASGEFIKPLDADDMLPPGALAREVDVFIRYSQIGWVVSKTLDLRPDGTTVPNPLGMGPAEGPLGAGVIWDTILAWENHPGYPPDRPGNRSEPDPWWAAVIQERTEQGLQSAPLHPNALMVRTGVLMMLGGWPGVYSGEDTALLLALEAVAPGYFVGAPGLLYREWPDSFRGTGVPNDPQIAKGHRRLMMSRVEELRRSGIRWNSENRL